MDISDLLQQLGQVNQSTQADIADLPNAEAQAKQLYFGGADRTTQSLQGDEESKIQALYQHDKLLSQQYAPQQQNSANPVPTQGPSTTQSVASSTGLQGVDPSLIENPFQNIMFGGKQDENTLGELVHITNLIKQRHDALGNAVDKAVEAAQTKVTAGKYKSDALQAMIDKLQKQEELRQGQEKIDQSGAGGGVFRSTAVNPVILGYLGNVKDSYGHVTPDQYLQAKTAYIGMGGKSSDFDTEFQQFRDPNNTKYQVDPQSYSKAELAAQKKTQDTATNYKTAIGSINNLLGQYDNLSGTEKGNPLFGFLSGNNPLSGAKTYNSQLRGLAAQLKTLAGAGAGSGVRVNNYELKNWADLLPSPTDTSTQITQKIKSLNAQMNAVFGQGLDQGTLQQYGVKTSGNANAKSNANGTVLMTDASGKQWNVPSGKVQLFKQNGYK